MLIKHIFLILGFLSISCVADAMESYKVENIIIYNNAANAKEAKENAIEEGKKRAFQILLTKLFPKDNEASQQILDNIEKYVLDLELIHEKFSSKSYRAVMNVTFNKSLIQEQSLPTMSQSVDRFDQEEKIQNYIVCFTKVKKLQDWLYIQKLLKENIKGIDSVKLITLSTNLITYEINFSIPVQELAEGMASNNIIPIKYDDKIELKFN